jgi:uncharacterized alpha-E superfamily protein
MWQCLNDFYHTMRDGKLDIALQKEDPITVLDNLLKKGLLYFGTTDVTMARGEGNSLINIGKFLERAIQSTDILDIKFSTLHQSNEKVMDTTYWKYLLMSIAGYELYLKTYRSGFEAANVVEQIVLNDRFPRSIIYSITRLHRYFERLKNDGNTVAFDHINFLIGKVKSNVQFSKAQSLTDDALHLFLKQTKIDLFDVGNALSNKYFTYA